MQGDQNVCLFLHWKRQRCNSITAKIESVANYEKQMDYISDKIELIRLLIKIIELKLGNLA